MRGVTRPDQERFLAVMTFQLTRLMRGVTQGEVDYCTDQWISTHTPHARRDLTIAREYDGRKISTHTPHARRDDWIGFHWRQPYVFQLTRLMRGVTKCVIIISN